MKRGKVNIIFELTIIAIVAAYAFFIVFQLDHEIPKAIFIDDPIVEDKNVTILNLMTYNIAHGRGHLSMYEKSSFGRNFNIKSKGEVISRMDDISEFVKENNIDILILQEVDFDTSWSYHVDEAKYIAERAGFSNVVEGLKWSIDLPFFDIRSGNAILSKYPLLSASVRKFSTESFFTRFIGGHSYINALYLVNGQPVRIIGTHFDSASPEIREEQAEQLIFETLISEQPVIIAGDLNAITPSAKNQSEYLKYKFTDDTIELFMQSGLYDIDLGLLRPAEDFMYTYSAEDPHRLIDYIILTKDLEASEYYVERINLSDHFPLAAKVIIRN